MASLGQYILDTDRNDVYLNLFISNTTKLDLNGKTAEIKVETKFPWESRMNIFVKAQDGLKLHIRIPDYAINFVIQGEKNIKYKKENHYAVIDLNSDTSFSISFDMKAVWVAANSNIREDIGKAALVKGPIVYCFEETDNGSNLASVYVDAHSTIEEKYVTVPTECIALYVKGKRMIMEERDLYFLLTSTKCESVELKAIPYAYWCNRVPGEMAVWMKYLNYDPV